MGAPTLREVISRETSFVRRTLSQLGVHENDINDVTQEVLLAVNKGLPTFDPSLAAEPDKAIRAWLFGICERQAANLRRRSSRRSEVITSDETINNFRATDRTPKIAGCGKSKSCSFAVRSPGFRPSGVPWWRPTTSTESRCKRSLCCSGSPSTPHGTGGASGS